MILVLRLRKLLEEQEVLEGGERFDLPMRFCRVGSQVTFPIELWAESSMMARGIFLGGQAFSF